MMPPTWPAIKVRTAANELRTNESRRRYALRFLFARSILRLPGVALRLRVPRIERHDFRTKRITEDSVSLANGSDRNSLISEMSRSEQKSSLPAAPLWGQPPSMPLPAILETFAN